jgi:ribokinase
MAPLGVEPETAIIRDAAVAEGLDADFVDVGQPTDLSSLMVAPDGENCIVSTGACAFGLDEVTALGFVAAMRPGDVLLMQGNLSLAATLAAARGAPFTVLNTAPVRWDYADLTGLCAVVVANAGEAAALTGRADPREAALALSAGGAAIVTLGAAGCVLAAPDPRLLAAEPVAVVDTTGAGDVFCGVLAACLVLGRPLADAVIAAQLAAAIAVGREGCYPAFPTRGEMRAILAPW